MSTSLAKNEILRFLASPAPKVLCIKGKWGVGKTFAWKQYLSQAGQKIEGIAADRYSYVSLFGVNSLAELKYAIFEGTMQKGQVDKRASIETFRSAIESAEGLGRKNAWILKAIPILRDYFSSAAPAFFLTVRNQIICIDDLERKGANLRAADVLGLISFLKEERGCKIALLLNDEELEGEDEEKFYTYLEKVVDVNVKFAPTPDEAISFAFGDTDDVSILVSKKCISLGISNIRVIKKIERVAREIRQLLDKFDKEVFEVVVASLALFVWSYHQPKTAPPLEYLEIKRSTIFYDPGEEDVSPDEAAWNALLDSYGYTWTDEFDLTLIEGVKDGYFDPEKINNHARILNEKILAARADNSFSDAWDLYHGSFDNNQEEVLDSLYDAFIKNFQHISPLNLNGTVTLFKELGRTEQASQMIHHYVSGRDEERKFFDLSEHPFSGEITDTDVINAFKEKCASLADTRDMSAMLLRLKDSWNSDTLSALSSASVGFYYRTFKEHSGEDLKRMIAGVLQFDRVVDATEQMNEIAKRGKEALKLIGEESPINARRVAKYGIKVEHKPPVGDSNTTL